MTTTVPGDQNLERGDSNDVRKGNHRVTASDSKPGVRAPKTFRGVFVFCALSLIAVPAWAGGARLGFVFWVQGDRPSAGLRTVYIVVNGSDTLSRAVRAEAARHHLMLGNQPAPAVATITIRAELALKRLGGVPHVLDYAEAVEETRKEAIADPNSHLGTDWQWSIQPGDFLSGELRQTVWRRSGIADELVSASSACAARVRATYTIACGQKADTFAGILLTAHVSEAGTLPRQLLVSATSIFSTLDSQALFMRAVDSLMAELAHPGTGSSAALPPVMIRRPPTLSASRACLPVRGAPGVRAGWCERADP